MRWPNYTDIVHQLMKMQIREHQFDFQSTKALSSSSTFVHPPPPPPLPHPKNIVLFSSLFNEKKHENLTSDEKLHFRWLPFVVVTFFFPIHSVYLSHLPSSLSFAFSSRACNVKNVMIWYSTSMIYITIPSVDKPNRLSFSQFYYWNEAVKIWKRGWRRRRYS